MAPSYALWRPPGAEASNPASVALDAQLLLDRGALETRARGRQTLGPGAVVRMLERLG